MYYCDRSGPRAISLTSVVIMSVPQSPGFTRDSCTTCCRGWNEILFVSECSQHEVASLHEIKLDSLWGITGGETLVLPCLCALTVSSITSDTPGQMSRISFDFLQTHYDLIKTNGLNLTLMWLGKPLDMWLEDQAWFLEWGWRFESCPDCSNQYQNYWMGIYWSSCHVRSDWIFFC